MSRRWNASRRTQTRLTARRRWRLGAGAVLGAATTVFWYSRCPPRFPDQLPGGTSDVSAQQALSDHHLALPISVHGWRYSAQRGDQSYTLTAEFAFSCAELRPFTGGNAFDSVAGPFQLADIGVYDLALNLGWRDITPGALWYQRLDGDQNVGYDGLRRPHPDALSRPHITWNSVVGTA